MAARYKQLYNEMLEKYSELFAQFRQIHDKYATDRKRYQTEYNKIGSEVQLTVAHYLRLLCGKSESSGYSQFSGGLADKFVGLIRAEFVYYDYIGLK